jgi:hypothetical protein
MAMLKSRKMFMWYFNFNIRYIQDVKESRILNGNTFENKFDVREKLNYEGKCLLRNTDVEKSNSEDVAISGNSFIIAYKGKKGKTSKISIHFW